VHPWVAASSIAVLVATVPLCWVYRVLQVLPEPISLSHRRWPYQVNLAIILFVTVVTAGFIRSLYYTATPPTNPILDALRLLIAAPVYILAFVLLIRQYVGLYPDYFVASGRGGFTVRKRLYQNVVRVEEKREIRGETEVLLYMKSRERLILTVSGRDLGTLYTLIRESAPPD